MKKLVLGIVLMFLLSISLLLAVSAGIESQSHAATLNSMTSANWLIGWSYRKAHNITGSLAGEQFNYPVLLNVHYNHGADTQSDVYLGGKCKNDFGDIRFTDSSGVSPLDYYVQMKSDGNNALTWVKVNEIPQYPNCTTIYIYYGNQNASSISNKDWVLDSFSDFEDGTTQGWTISWTTFVNVDGVSSNPYGGNFSRCAGRIYGADRAGIGEFHDQFY
jgi:hypothetical protein